MKTILIMVMMWFGVEAFGEEKKADSWFCTDESGKRDHDSLWACGVGEAMAESTARQEALKQAFIEFGTICNQSDDCHGYKVYIEPKRLTCVEQMFGPNKIWKCYRLIEVHISKERKELGQALSHGDGSY